MSSTLNPYLQFRDQAKSALEFYHRVLGGDLILTTFAEMGVEGAEGEKIMHGRLDTEAGYTIMASDTPEEMEYTPGTNVSLSLGGDDVEILRNYFAGLSEGADVTMPLAVQMWGDEFGMLKDKFGTSWMVNIQSSPQRG